MRFLSMMGGLFSSQKKTSIGDQIVYWLLIGIVFLVPIFFLPTNSFPVEFNKTLLFTILVLVAASIFIASRLMSRSFELVRTSIDWWMVAFVGLYLISFIFSQDRYASLVGVSSHLSSGIMVTVSLVLFVFLLTQIVRSQQQLMNVVISFLTSLLIGAVVTVLQLGEVYLFSASVTQTSVFNPFSNSILMVGVVMVIGILLSLAVGLSDKRRWLWYTLAVVVCVMITTAFLLGTIVPLYILGAAVLAILLVAIGQAKKISRWLVIIPALIVTVSIVLILLSTSSVGPTPVSSRISVDYGTSFSVATSAAVEAPLWGSGPQTFATDFNLHRPASFNNAEAWNTRFVKGANYWTDLLATTGVGVVATLIGIIIIVSIRLLRFIRQQIRSGRQSFFVTTLFSTWVALLVISFIYPFTMVLQLSWWLLLGLLLASLNLDRPVTQSVVLKHSPKAFGSVVTVVLVIVALTGGVIFFGLRTWVADHHYTQAQLQIRDQVSFTAITDSLDKATSLNPYESKYFLSLAQGYATQAQLVSNQPDGDIEITQQYAQSVIDNSNAAIAAQPNNPAVYEAVVALYDGMRTIIGNVDELSVAALEQAITLEPNSAFTRLNLGRARTLYAQRIISLDPEQSLNDEARGLLNTAITDFNLTKELKQDFLVADFNIALTYQIMGQPDQAIAHLTSTAARYPEQPDVLYTLATLYYEAGELERALQWYQQVVDIEPGYSGVYWQRSFIYEAQGDIEAAINELDILLGIIPENIQAAERRAELQAAEE